MDSDRDQNEEENCAKTMGSGWWHRSCTHANLNGRYKGEINKGVITTDEKLVKFDRLRNNPWEIIEDFRN